MQDDEPKKPETDEFDDVFEDDFTDEDFDDIEMDDMDSIEDLDVEDLDIDDSEIWDEDADEIGGESTLGAGPAKRKSGAFYKNKMVLAGAGIVVIGAIAFVALSGGGEQASRMPVPTPGEGSVVAGEEALEAAQTMAENDMPPMPVPMDGEPALPEDDDDIALNEQDGAFPSLPEQDAASPLTPMPGMPAQEQEQAGEDPLDTLPGLNETDEDVLAQAENMPSFELPPEPDEVRSAREAEQTPEAEEGTLFDLPQDLADGQESVDEPEVSDENADDESAVLGFLEEDANTQVEAPLTPDADSQEQQDALENLRARETELTDKTQEQARALSEANKKITTLEGTVDDLETRISALNEALEEAQNTAQAAQAQLQAKSAAPAASSERVDQEVRAPAPERKTVPAPATKSPSPAPAATALSYRWTLRSAQPGRATIADEATQDMRTIEVGDSVPGLGRIQSIAPVNGLWVVQGSTGKVSQ